VHGGTRVLNQTFLFDEADSVGSAWIGAKVVDRIHLAQSTPKEKPPRDQAAGQQLGTELQQVVRRL
jgi:hypothetical protein